MDKTLLVFARTPQPGTVKTRLIPHIGEQKAFQLYLQMLQQCIAMCDTTGISNIQLWCYPSIDHVELKKLSVRYNISLKQQNGNDVGERMYQAARDVLETGSTPVIIGSDIPSLTNDDVAQAFDALESGADVVFSPAEDGGYALIGLNRVDTSLFDGIAWGTSSVYIDSVARVKQLGWTYAKLATRWDVDNYEDYKRYIDLR